MKNAKVKVKLSVEETEIVAGGFSMSSINLASLTQPKLGVYAQVAPMRVSALKPVATNVGALQPVSPILKALQPVSPSLF